MIPLDAVALATLVGQLPGWRCEGNALVRVYIFSDFSVALDFMQSCVGDINRLNHHPEWRNVYDRVDVRLTTHAAGNRITALDGELAQLLDARAVNAGAKA